MNEEDEKTRPLERSYYWLLSDFESAVVDVVADADATNNGRGDEWVPAINAANNTT